MDMLDSGALEAVRLNSAMPPGSEFSDRDPESDSDWGRDDSETAGNGDSWRRACVTSSAAGRAVMVTTRLRLAQTRLTAARFKDRQHPRPRDCDSYDIMFNVKVVRVHRQWQGEPGRAVIK